MGQLGSLDLVGIRQGTGWSPERWSVHQEGICLFVHGEWIPWLLAGLAGRERSLSTRGWPALLVNEFLPLPGSSEPCWLCAGAGWLSIQIFEIFCAVVSVRHSDTLHKAPYKLIKSIRIKHYF